MSLIPESLKEVERGIFWSESDRLGSVGTKNGLFAFRQRGQSDIGHADFSERAAGGPELTLSAVYDEKVRERAFFIHPALKISGDDLSHRTVIVVSPISFDAHVPVFALLRRAVLEHDGASDRVSSLMMADVEAHDEARDDLQVEPVPQIVEYCLGPVFDLLQGGEAILEGVACVVGGELRQPGLRPLLGCVQVDFSSRLLRQDVLDQLSIVEVGRNQYFARETRPSAHPTRPTAQVIPRREGGDQRRVALVPDVGKSLRIPAQEYARSNSQNDGGGQITVSRQPYNVIVPAPEPLHPLLSCQRVEARQDIAKTGGTLEFQGFRSFLHEALYATAHTFGLTLQNLEDFPDHLPVRGLIL